MQEALVITVGVGHPGQRAKAGCMANDRLIDLFPEFRWPHESFVIETCCQKIRHHVIHRHHIKTERWPPVLASGDKSVKQLGCRCPRVRLGECAFAKRDNRIWLLGTGTQHAARTVIFERPAHEPHTIRQQGRGQRIATMTLEGFSIKAEAQLG